MIEERGQVVDIDNDGVWVEVNRKSACASCAAKSGCGQRVIAENLAAKSVVICLDKPDHVPVAVGDNVVMGIAEGAFLKASALLYCLPLLSLIVFAGIVSGLGASEGFVILAAAIGLAAGLISVAKLARHSQRAKEYQPIILRTVFG